MRKVPLGAYLQRHRRNRAFYSILVISILIGLVAADRLGLLAYRGNDLTRYHNKTFLIARVIDGDTLAIDVPDNNKPTTRVRLWGINTPELARPRENQPAEPFAEEAKAFAERLCADAKVKLELQPHYPRDKYDRIVAYVILPDGRVLNELLLTAGLAVHDSHFAHRDLDRYRLLQEQAQFDRIGIWKK